MSFPNLHSQFTTLSELEKMPTWLLGLAILIAISLPTVNLYRRRALSKSAQPERLSSLENKLINGKPLSERVKEPNFGFGEVRVSKILVHPIKSCRGTSVQSALYTPEGLVNDRKWCIIDAQTKAVITAREVSKMVLISPTIEADEKAAFGGTLNVSFPPDSGCEAFSIPLRPTQEVLDKWTLLDNVTMFDIKVMDGYICQSVTPATGRSPSTILSSYFEKPVHLLCKGPQPRACNPTALFPQLSATTDYPDGYPLLFLSEESVEVVEKELRGHVGKQGIDQRWSADRLVIERFRPNVVFKGGEAFAEDWWEQIAIGSKSPEFLVVSKCHRCLLPNVSPETGIRDKAVPFKVLMKYRTGVDSVEKMAPCMGCNGVPLGSGELKVGDVVSVRKIGMT